MEIKLYNMPSVTDRVAEFSIEKIPSTNGFTRCVVIYCGCVYTIYMKSEILTFCQNSSHFSWNLDAQKIYPAHGAKYNSSPAKFDFAVQKFKTMPNETNAHQLIDEISNWSKHWNEKLKEVLKAKQELEAKLCKT